MIKKIDQTPATWGKKESLQMTLFGSFLKNDNDGQELSNLIDVWEGIPKYFLNDKQQQKLRTDGGHADPFSFDFEYQDSITKHKFKRNITIQPALIKEKDGNYKAYFPSVTEELVEEALKKIFSDQNYSLHDVEDVTSWVRFSLRMIYRELKAKGRERNIAQIKKAIDILSNCVITVKEGKEVVYRGAILTDVMPVDREAYKEDSEKHWIAKLPAILSFAINNLRFRQFNMGRLLECDDPLSRFLYRRMITHYRNANYENTFPISYSELEHSGHLILKPNEGRKKVIKALDELQEHSIISHYKFEIEKKGNKVIKVEYTLHPSFEFISEQKASNRRSRDNYDKALHSGLVIER